MLLYGGAAEIRTRNTLLMYDGLAIRCLTIGPQLHMAEVQGFEPQEPFGSTVFKTAAFNLSATLPICQTLYTSIFNGAGGGSRTLMSCDVRF